MNGYIRIGFAVAGCLAVLGGCSSRDPYARDDVWYPTGAPAADLAAQVANPADLVGGRDDPRQNSGAAIKAVNHIWSDTPKAMVGDTPAGSTTGAGGGGPPASPAGGT